MNPLGTTPEGATLLQATMMKLRHDLPAIFREFEIGGTFRDAVPYGSGHINDTYLVTSETGGNEVRHILQRINHEIFKNPVALMENIERVTNHIGAKLADTPDRARRVLRLVPSRQRCCFHRDDAGNTWRVYNFIEGAGSHDAVTSTSQAFAAAQAFGRFQGLLADLPDPPLNVTIPDFHHTPKRFEAFEAALAADVANRAVLAKSEIDFALRQRPLAGVLLEAGLPQRVTHNDTKLNNVMIDEATGEGICVIDLDTLMPGLALYDFGDMVRTATSPAQEDERDLAKVTMQPPMFEALVRGYLDAAGDVLTVGEKRLLVASGKVITFETGIRFLTDFLAGDTYFKVHRENHNLDRCRTQFRLVESIEQQEAAMNKVVESFA